MSVVRTTPTGARRDRWPMTSRGRRPSRSCRRRAPGPVRRTCTPTPKPHPCEPSGDGPGAPAADADLVGGHRLDGRPRQQPRPVGQAAPRTAACGRRHAGRRPWRRGRRRPTETQVAWPTARRGRRTRPARRSPGPSCSTCVSRSTCLAWRIRCRPSRAVRTRARRGTRRAADPMHRAISTPSTSDAGVVQPAFARLVEQRQRAQPAHPLVGLGRHLRLGRAAAQSEIAHRFQQRLRPPGGEVHAQPEPEREEVAHGDRSVRGARWHHRSDPRPSTSTGRPASSGRRSSTGSSRRRRHSSTRTRAPTATIGLVVEEMRKMVSRATGAPPRLEAPDQPDLDLVVAGGQPGDAGDGVRDPRGRPSSRRAGPAGRDRIRSSPF